MKGFVTIIGIDPGPVPGLCSTHWRDGALEGSCTMQSTPAEAAFILRQWLQPFPESPGARFVVQIERFVVGRRATRSSTAGAGEVTRDLVGQLQSVCADLDVKLVWLCNAAQVKAWATDERLKAAGLYVRGLQHGRDAARHALYRAVAVGVTRDPLSKRSSSA